MKKLTGKIYWFLGNLKLVDGEYVKIQPQITKITDVIIDDAMIKFDWQSARDIDGGIVRLLNDHGSNFSGKATILDSDENSIDVRCELFENKKGYVLMGSWVEDTDFYTWWAEIRK